MAGLQAADLSPPLFHFSGFLCLIFFFLLFFYCFSFKKKNKGNLLLLPELRIFSTPTISIYRHMHLWITTSQYSPQNFLWLALLSCTFLCAFPFILGPLSPLGLKLLLLSVVNFAFLLWVDTIYGRPRSFQVSLFLFFTIFLESTLTVRPAIYGDHDMWRIHLNSSHALKYWSFPILRLYNIFSGKIYY